MTGLDRAPHLIRVPLPIYVCSLRVTGKEGRKRAARQPVGERRPRGLQGGNAGTGGQQEAEQGKTPREV